jgi:hypothetical protein
VLCGSPLATLAIAPVAAQPNRRSAGQLGTGRPRDAAA